MSKGPRGQNLAGGLSTRQLSPAAPTLEIHGMQSTKTTTRLFGALLSGGVCSKQTLQKWWPSCWFPFTSYKKGCPQKQSHLRTVSKATIAYLIIRCAMSRFSEFSRLIFGKLWVEANFVLVQVIHVQAMQEYRAKLEPSKHPGDDQKHETTSLHTWASDTLPFRAAGTNKRGRLSFNPHSRGYVISGR